MKKQSRAKKDKCHDKVAAKIPAVAPSVSYEGQTFDTMLQAWIGRFTCWLSPASIGIATYDWLSHLAMSPAKQYDLIEKAYKNIGDYVINSTSQFGFGQNQDELSCVQPRANDYRFKNKDWEEFPFDLYAQSFLLSEKWWNDATSTIRGVSKHHKDVVNFMARQILDMFSPTNFPQTNPEIITATICEGGANFVRGWSNYLEDARRIYNKQPPIGTEKFQVGVNVAVTEGKVVYRNHLIELIQYEPVSSEVYAEPILIIPAWIMKYYILDLSAHNSLVKYLVNRGHTVFMISWKNPDSKDRDLGLDDYLNLGIMNSVDVINKIIPEQKIHAVGYCLGGTLLMIAAAAMAGQEDAERLKTITLFAAQIDFRDPGELSLFIDHSQINFLEDNMWEKGYLDGPQMAWAFSMLRSNDLIWSRMVHDYLLGKRRPMNDLMAWDYDTTRLPYRMHSEYLHNLFLNNDLVRGRYEVGKKRIALSDIKIPIFAVSTIKDHVSPWRSVYKIHLYTYTEVTFVLTNGGHNAGIVSEPGHVNRHYQMQTRKKDARHIGPDTWLESAPDYPGSWWPAWEEWLVAHSNQQKVLPPSIGNPKKDYPILCDAPGTYVLQK